jgi:hypothetical protein
VNLRDTRFLDDAKRVVNPVSALQTVICVNKRERMR